MEFQEAWPYVVGVYIGIWAVLLIYVIVLQNKLAAVKRELDSLSKAVERKG
ncbi:MAG: hypothetical protein KGZ93_10765 [Actinobacteria bacterium]|jgi:hypothetical protein|nr:hypothetical protein [Actinomycetota bacterium]